MEKGKRGVGRGGRRERGGQEREEDLINTFLLQKTDARGAA